MTETATPPTTGRGETKGHTHQSITAAAEIEAGTTPTLNIDTIAKNTTRSRTTGTPQNMESGGRGTSGGRATGMRGGGGVTTPITRTLQMMSLQPQVQIPTVMGEGIAKNAPPTLEVDGGGIRPVISIITTASTGLHHLIGPVRRGGRKGRGRVRSSGYVSQRGV